MKRKNLVLLLATLFVGIFFTGCSTQKNYNMSYEQVIALLENQAKEMMDMFFNFETQQKDVNLSTKLDTDELNLDLDIQSQTKIDYDSQMQDMTLSFDADVKIPESELDFSSSGAINYALIGDDMYLKLSKFSLKGPSAKDLAMVNMAVNGFKGQRFKLNMSDMNMSKAFDFYKSYNEKLGEMVKTAGQTMINEGYGVYDGMFDDFKGYNARKYSIDKEKLDENLHMYTDMMNEFYSGLFTQYATNLGKTNEELGFVDFNTVLSGITYDNMQGYFIIVGKNEVVETMENAKINIDGTGIVLNYYYGKDGLYLETKTQDGEDLMLLVANRDGKTYTVYANINSMLGIKGDIKINNFSKKLGIDLGFDLIMTVNVEPDSVNGDDVFVKTLNMEIPIKGKYTIKNIDKFSIQEPSDAVDLMEILGGYIGNVDEQYQDDGQFDDEIELVDSSVEIE